MSRIPATECEGNVQHAHNNMTTFDLMISIEVAKGSLHKTKYGRDSIFLAKVQRDGAAHICCSVLRTETLPINHTIEYFYDRVWMRDVKGVLCPNINKSLTMQIW